MNSDTFQEVKDFVLGLIVLLIFISLFVVSQLLGTTNPAFNAPSSRYHCESTAVGQECKQSNTLP